MSLSNDAPEGPSNTSTLSSRNPTKKTIPSRSRAQGKTSNAEKITADARRALNKENGNALQLEIAAFFDSRKAEIARLAKKYNKTESHIKQLLSNESSYQNTRAPSLHNALVHAKGLEMNEGK
jgi:hypothetical protein